MNILVIDDDRFFTDVLSETLRLENFDVSVVNRASDILDDLSVIDDKDCIILDIMMRCPPEYKTEDFDETGYLILDRIRKRTNEKLVIVISGKDREELKIKFKDGRTEYFAKPLDRGYRSLVQRIHSL